MYNILCTFAYKFSNSFRWVTFVALDCRSSNTYSRASVYNGVHHYYYCLLPSEAFLKNWNGRVRILYYYIIKVGTCV